MRSNGASSSRSSKLDLDGYLEELTAGEARADDARLWSCRWLVVSLLHSGFSQRFAAPVL